MKEKKNKEVKGASIQTVIDGLVTEVKVNRELLKSDNGIALPEAEEMIDGYNNSQEIRSFVDEMIIARKSEIEYIY